VPNTRNVRKLCGSTNAANHPASSGDRGCSPWGGWRSPGRAIDSARGRRTQPRHFSKECVGDPPDRTRNRPPALFGRATREMARGKVADGWRVRSFGEAVMHDSPNQFVPPPDSLPPSSPHGTGAVLSADERDALVVMCFAKLRRIASRMLSRFTSSRRQEDTDDLLQNAALRLRRALNDVVLQSPGHAMALAVTQIRRELVDLIRRLRRRPDGAADTLFVSVATPTEQLDAWEAFHEAVGRLPNPQKEAVHFLWYLGLEQNEAARLLGISTRTLRRNWRLARRTLQASLGDVDFGQ
jgi:RNA polymerase sigma factor (sigma-70 family)